MRFALKPCPFCGNDKPTLLELSADWYVECGKCTAQMVLVGSQAQAVLNWNARREKHIGQIEADAVTVRLDRDLDVRLDRDLDKETRDEYTRGWNDAVEAAARAAVENGDMLEIHSSRIADAIRKLSR